MDVCEWDSFHLGCETGLVLPCCVMHVWVCAHACSLWLQSVNVWLFGPLEEDGAFSNIQETARKLRLPVVYRNKSQNPENVCIAWNNGTTLCCCYTNTDLWVAGFNVWIWGFLRSWESFLSSYIDVFCCAYKGRNIIEELSLLSL